MASAVYILCAVTSFICAFLLFRAYRANRFKLLFWCAVAFTGFTLNNILLFLDEEVIHHIDMSIIRTIPGSIAIILMVYGLIKEET